MTTEQTVNSPPAELWDEEPSSLEGRVRIRALALVGPPLAVLVARANGVGMSLISWVVGALALTVVFGVAGHILRMAWQSARRGILNQHVLLETGAFAGIAGGRHGPGRTRRSRDGGAHRRGGGRGPGPGPAG